MHGHAVEARAEHRVATPTFASPSSARAPMRVSNASSAFDAASHSGVFGLHGWIASGPSSGSAAAGSTSGDATSSALPVTHFTGATCGERATLVACSQLAVMSKEATVGARIDVRLNTAGGEGSAGNGSAIDDG